MADSFVLHIFKKCHRVLCLFNGLPRNPRSPIQLESCHIGHRNPYASLLQSSLYCPLMQHISCLYFSSALLCHSSLLFLLQQPLDTMEYQQPCLMGTSLSRDQKIVLQKCASLLSAKLADDCSPEGNMP